MQRSGKNVVTIFGKRLRELREKKGWTQQQIAEQLNVQRTTYSWYEAGRLPSMETLRKLAQIFGVSVDYLFGVDNDFKIKSVDFEGEWPEGAQIFRRGTRELTDAQKRDVEVMLRALMNNVPKEDKKGESQ